MSLHRSTVTAKDGSIPVFIIFDFIAAQISLRKSTPGLQLNKFKTAELTRFMSSLGPWDHWGIKSPGSRPHVCQRSLSYLEQILLQLDGATLQGRPLRQAVAAQEEEIPARLESYIPSFKAPPTPRQGQQSDGCKVLVFQYCFLISHKLISES